MYNVQMEGQGGGVENNKVSYLLLENANMQYLSIFFFFL